MTPMTPIRSLTLLTALLTLATACSSTQYARRSSDEEPLETIPQKTIVDRTEDFFGEASGDLASVLGKAFEEYGEPNGYVFGEEASGALAVGVRYGRGQLVVADGTVRDIYWQGPSIGFDAGGNASKVLILVYNLSDPNQVFGRFPGVEGSLYFVAGASLNYHQRDDGIVLAPVRTGVGWRQGANIGYLKVTEESTANPF